MEVNFKAWLLLSVKDCISEVSRFDKWVFQVLLAAFAAAQEPEVSILPTAVTTSNVQLRNLGLCNIIAFIPSLLSRLTQLFYTPLSSGVWRVHRVERFGYRFMRSNESRLLLWHVQTSHLRNSLWNGWFSVWFSHLRQQGSSVSEESKSA